ncbi:MAG TPA: serine/threonine-protein kinase [Terriglobales bacterium]|nr:serine/threonine-protein kinase [Terriglobales bacterium]
MSSLPVKLDVGQTVGDYEILSLLGRGGMGKVFKVRNLISDRIEAMKVLLPDADATPELAERFAREIKLVATLEHPNIAALRTALRVGSQMLMIMEFVEGTSLEQQIQSQKPDWGRAVHFAVQVLPALSYAHQHGVVHRDVKPSNILVRADDSVKLTDFGIASRVGDPRLTGAGMALGSLYYMSPEQVKALPCDARSDIYSTGVTLYESVTGRRPIQGDSFHEIMTAHLEQRPIPPIQLAPEISPALSAIIEHSLAKAPEHRFQTAAEFRAALLSVHPEADSHAAATAPYLNAAPVRTVHPIAAPSSESTHSFDPALLETARKKLATYIGPMAKVIVSRAAKNARSRQDLYEKLAAEIPSPGDRQTFLRSLPL